MTVMRGRAPSKKTPEIAVDEAGQVKLAGSLTLTPAVDQGAAGTSPWPVLSTPAGLAPPTGATLTGDDAAHALGALTGAGHVVIAAAGGVVRIGSASTPPTSTTGFPVVAGASYDWQALLLEDVRVYVPAGTTAIWGAHQ
jgi:hypothetical protein